MEKFKDGFVCFIWLVKGALSNENFLAPNMFSKPFLGIVYTNFGHYAHCKV